VNWSIRLPESRLGVAVLLLVAGCASTEPDFVAARDSWHGVRYDDVVKAWGPPDRSDTKSGRETHTWVARDGLPTPGLHGGAVVSGGAGGGAGGALFGSSNEATAVCDRTLVFSGGRVVEQTFNGPPDFCKRFKKQ
jgi:hypothetical protein